MGHYEATFPIGKLLVATKPVIMLVIEFKHRRNYIGIAIFGTFGLSGPPRRAKQNDDLQTASIFEKLLSVSRETLMDVIQLVVMANISLNFTENQI